MRNEEWRSTKSCSSSGRAVASGRIGQGLLLEAGDVGGVSFGDSSGDDGSVEGGDEESANASRKARAPLVGVSICLALGAAFFRGFSGNEGSRGSAGLAADGA